MASSIDVSKPTEVNAYTSDVRSNFSHAKSEIEALQGDVAALPIANINLDGGTDIGADLADADLLLVDDGGAGTNRKSALSRVWTYILAKLAAGNPQVATLELGHASDTTLARASAGVVNLEGVPIVTTTATQTLTNKTLGAATLSGTLDGDGQEIARNLTRVVTSVSGTLTIGDHSGCVLVTSGNVTVPTTAGFNAVIIAGGAHTVSFNSTTSAALASGDLMTVVVQSSTVIHAVKTAAADKVSFT